MVNSEVLRTDVVSSKEHLIADRGFVSIPLWTSYGKLRASLLCVIHREQGGHHFAEECASSLGRLNSRISAQGAALSKVER